LIINVIILINNQLKHTHTHTHTHTQFVG